MSRLIKNLIPFLALAAVCLVAAGCGAMLSEAGAGAGAASGKTLSISQKDEERIVGAEGMTPEQKHAACEAMRCAEESNAGSRFEATFVRIVNGWARVTVEQKNVPAEEAVAFDVFLQARDDRTWEVADTGNDVSPGQITGAPDDLFKK